MSNRTATLKTVRRAMEDDELQEHLRNAFVAARKLNTALAAPHDAHRPRFRRLALLVAVAAVVYVLLRRFTRSESLPVADQAPAPPVSA